MVLYLNKTNKFKKMNKRKKIAITIGDPAGVGPEVALKAIQSPEVTALCEPVIIGDISVIEEAVEKMRLPMSIDNLSLIPLYRIKTCDFTRSNPSAENGAASVAYIAKAIELAVSKAVDAIVTAPISKESLKMAGLHWPGHTEMLAELTSTKDYAMVFYSRNIRLILATIHTAIKDIPAMITEKRILKTIIMAKKACAIMGIKNPEIAVAGLNPHAGEAGMFGSEETEAITPAIKKAQSLGIKASGPYPADALFHRAYRGDYDMVVCMYHDQGLAPLKMIAFDDAVNITIGLPFIRTSPDHGTAYDIAWKGIANPSSMIEAIKLATKLKI
jgi:4-hydroxythreonine-4-phosphate dehydrogenase